MLRAVLALHWLQGGACIKTERKKGVPPPSKKSKKVDCGNWNHPDSEKNTRTTVFGKVGMVCRGRKFATRGTGFDDDGPEYGEKDDDYEYADPYVCWNKHLYKAYVGWNLAAAYIFSWGFFAMKLEITYRPQKPAPQLWNIANLLVQMACLVEGIISYFILTSKTIRGGGGDRSGKCSWFV